MLCRDIMDIIEKSYPVSYAMDWDNVGLLAGRDDKEVKHIYVALDVTDEVIDRAIEAGADMLVTHHPLIFGALKKINNQNFISNRVLKLIQNDISYYAMHTNYDVKGMAELSARKLHLGIGEVLEVTGEEADGSPAGIGRIASCENEMTLKACCELVKDAFSLESVQVFGNLDKKVRKIAICPGSGKSVIGVALSKEADVLITGDIGHHEGIDAVAQGMAVIDAGHYGVEHIFIRDMGDFLRERITGVTVTEAPTEHPFTVI